MATILHLLAPGLATGTAKQLRLLADHLPSDEFASYFCSFERMAGPQSILKEILSDLTFCRQSKHFDPTFVFRVAKILRQTRSDVIHFWGQHQLTPLRLAMRMAGCEPKLIQSVRSTSDLALDTSITTVVNAQHLADAHPNAILIENAFVEPAETEVVSPLHRELNLEPNTRFIAAVGDLQPNKNIRDLVSAVDLLRVIRPELHLLIVGDGPDRESLERYINSNVAAAEIHLLGHRRDVPNILRQADVFWQASQGEGFSNAMAEAVASGLPIVTYDVPAHREVLGDSDLTNLVPLDDYAELARRTNVISLGRHAPETSISDRFQLETMIERYRDIYGELLVSRAAA